MERLLTPAEAGERLSVGRATVYRLIKTDGLMAVRAGGSTRIREADLARYIATRRPTTAAARYASAHRKD